MGIFKIFSELDESQNSCYISYYSNESCNEITLNIVNLLSDQYYHQLFTCESTNIQRWAQNLKQSPEVYLSQLYIALKEQFMIMDEGNRLEQKKVSLQNRFEIDGENNLIWKQFFEAKKIFGRKGKFPLEKKSKVEVLEAVLCSLMKEIHENEASVSKLSKENKKLKKEHENLCTIAEQSVTMKENFEREIYGKCAALLNTKKQKNLELRAQLLNIQDEAVAGSSHSKSSSGNRLTKQKEGSDDEYNDDTDVDSPNEVEVSDEDAATSSSLLKRKRSGNNTDNKKTKAGHEKSSSQEDFSQDHLNDSLEAELNVGSFSSPSFRRKF